MLSVKENNLQLMIARNVKKYRKLKNMTQKDLAIKCGLSYSYIRRIEGRNTSKSFSLHTLYLIARALDIEVLELFRS